MKNWSFLSLIFAISIISGCKKEVSEGVISSPDAFFTENVLNARQTFTINPSIFNAVQGAQGTRFEIQANSFTDLQGNPVSGFVQVTIVEIFGRNSMFMLNAPTMGYDPAVGMRQLVSGGMFHVEATQNGNPLLLAVPLGVKIPVDNSGGFDENMRKFDGPANLIDTLNWFLAEDSIVEVDTVGEAGLVYGILQNGWGWTNIDRWYSDPRPKTQLYVQVPAGYGPSNCEVFLSYDGEPNTLTPFDVWDSASQLFTEHYGQVPIGLECHFIAVTMIDDVLHYAIQGNTIGDDHVEVIVGWTATSQEELADLIDNLP